MKLILHRDREERINMSNIRFILDLEMWNTEEDKTTLSLDTSSNVLQDVNKRREARKLIEEIKDRAVSLFNLLNS